MHPDRRRYASLFAGTRPVPTIAGGPAHPDRRRRHLAVCRPAGRAVPTTAFRAGGTTHPDRRRRHPAVGWLCAGRSTPYDYHPGRFRAGGPVHPDRRRRHPTVCRPVGRTGAAFILCCRREAGSRLGQRRTGPCGPGTMCSRTTVRSALSHWSRACGRGDDSDAARAGPRGPGPAAYPNGFILGPAGRSRRGAIRVILDDLHWQSGRCGVLTRILVGAARNRRLSRATWTTDPERTARCRGSGQSLFARLVGTVTVTPA